MVFIGPELLNVFSSVSDVANPRRLKSLHWAVCSGPVEIIVSMKDSVMKVHIDEEESPGIKKTLIA